VGTAPVSHPSGQVHIVYTRYLCNKAFRHTVHLWANASRKQCTWAQIYYDEVRRRRKSHAMALRCLGQRWLKILWKMWQTNTLYSSDYHTANQLKHGSWVLQMKTT
jgi:hypothetical protein